MRSMILVFIFLSIQCIAQKDLIGKWCTPPGYVGYCIAFENDSKFSFKEWGCLGGEKGIGKYVVTGDSLTLSFEIPEDFKESGFHITEEKETNNDEIQIEFHVYTIDSDTLLNLPFANIEIGERINEDSIFFGQSVSTDFDGLMSTQLPRNKAAYEFRVTYVGYQSVQANFNPKSDYKIDVILYNPPYQITEDVRKYKIKSLKRNELVLSYFNIPLNKVVKTYFFHPN